MSTTRLPLPAAGALRVRAPWRGHLRSIVSWILFGVCAALFVSFRPATLGGTTSYAFVSGVSMLPVLHTGDLAIIVPKPAYEIGEIVAFRPGPGAEGAIIHRVVGGNAISGYLVQGDNKPDPDGIRPVPSQILGRAVLVVPSAGWVLAAIRTPAVLVALAALVATSTYLDRRAAQVARAEALAADREVIR